jgi:hypothetical protein
MPRDERIAVVVDVEGNAHGERVAECVRPQNSAIRRQLAEEHLLVRRKIETARG